MEPDFLDDFVSEREAQSPGFERRVQARFDARIQSRAAAERELRLVSAACAVAAFLIIVAAGYGVIQLRTVEIEPPVPAADAR